MPEILLPHSLSITLFLLLPAVSSSPCSVCHFLMSPQLLTFFPSSAHTFFSTSWSHPFSTPSFSLSMSPFLPPTPYASVNTILVGVSFLSSILYFLLGGDLQASCGTLDDGGLDDTRLDWEEEREMERLACEGDDFVPPKIMVRDDHYNDLQII